MHEIHIRYEYTEKEHTILVIPDRLNRKKFKRSAVSQERTLPTWLAPQEKGRAEACFLLMSFTSGSLPFLLLLYSHHGLLGDRDIYWPTLWFVKLPQYNFQTQNQEQFPQYEKK